MPYRIIPYFLVNNLLLLNGESLLKVNVRKYVNKSMSMISRNPKIIFQRYFFNTSFYIIILNNFPNFI